MIAEPMNGESVVARPEGLELVWKRPEALTGERMHYCPGCGHGVVHRLLMEVVGEMGVVDKTVGVAPVGCSVFAYDYLDVDMQEAAHGRAAAVATAIKRMLPDRIVFAYQGDGDLAAIGSAETLHAASRGENILVLFINNGIYGMTGGQMAPTTILGMKTSTTPEGREAPVAGPPLDMTALIATLPAPWYVTRQSVHTAGNVRKTKKAIERALRGQREGKGYSLIEVVSNCPSGWKMTPVESNRWMEEQMISRYPLGDLKVDGQAVQRKGALG